MAVSNDMRGVASQEWNGYSDVIPEKPVIKGSRKKDISIIDRPYLTLEEASLYFGIGINKLREISNEDNCNFVLYVGSKRMLKKEKLQHYLDEAFSI